MGQIQEAWAEHQMRTTANFATHNKLAAFFLGGLNRQIEHHLFPKVCHIHYGDIAHCEAHGFGIQFTLHRKQDFLRRPTLTLCYAQKIWERGSQDLI